MLKFPVFQYHYTYVSCQYYASKIDYNLHRYMIHVYILVYAYSKELSISMSSKSDFPSSIIRSFVCLIQNRLSATDSGGDIWKHVTAFEYILVPISRRQRHADLSIDFYLMWRQIIQIDSMGNEFDCNGCNMCKMTTINIGSQWVTM